MTNQNDDHHVTRQTVRDNYAQIAKTGGNSGCCGATSGDITPPSAHQMSAQFGYSDEEMNAVPEGANLGLGCGNPQAIADMKPGDVVVDLGSGAGFDAFLAAAKVGKTGHVIGIDMTHEMLTKARTNAQKVGHENVEFRLGEIEFMPVANDTADVIISNCVINLSPNKAQVFRESFRILKSGGRLAISDVVATHPFPDDFKDDDHLYSGCVTGASLVDDVKTWLKDAGFHDISIDIKEDSRSGIAEWAPGRGIEDFVVSAIITAIKPGVENDEYQG